VESSFQFRINGIIITHIGVRPVVVDGYPTEQREIVACDEKLGWFAVDDNDDLPDWSLSKFILEVRNFSIPVEERRFLPNRGWKQMTTKECMSLLESAGVIDKL
jgi:hypothetical protein